MNTRLARLDDGDYDAIILASAGLQRLGFDERIRHRLLAPGWLPAPAQGAIAIETRNDRPEVETLCAALDHLPTRICVEAERAMNRTLHGSCQVPVAAYAQLDGDRLCLHGMVGSASDGQAVRAYGEAPGDEADALGRRVGRDLLERGAEALIAASGAR